MAIDLNNKNLGTVSNKLKKVCVLKKVIIDKIDDSQKIKRLMTYMTTTPLSQEGYDYDNNYKKQKDLVMTMTKDTIEGNKRLFSHGFNPDMEEVKAIYIYVQNYTNKFLEKTGENTLMIHILCPELYNDLAFYGQERIYEIACEIIDILDEYTLDGIDQDEFGAVKFKIQGIADEGRMSKSKDVIRYTFPVKFKTLDVRCEEYE